MMMAVVGHKSCTPVITGYEDDDDADKQRSPFIFLTRRWWGSTICFSLLSQPVQDSDVCGLFEFTVVRFSFGSELARLRPTRSTESTQLVRSTQSAHSTFRLEDMEYCRMHASESHLGNDITESYIARFAYENPGYFSKLWNFWNRRTMWIRVLSGVYFLEVLAYLLPLCNEDTGPVTPML
ncbi:hypothetical protein Hdeb2414_s0010g00354841 [Helianthus debilis subsp. tardiflorus]